MSAVANSKVYIDKRLEVGLDPSNMPNHIAVIMDGNGRWAQERGLKRTDGHAAGEEALLDAVHGGLELGVEWLTVYAFSTENWKRPLSEVSALMKLLIQALRREARTFHDNGIIQGYIFQLCELAS